MGSHVQAAASALCRFMFLLMLIPLGFISQAQAVDQPGADQKITIVGEKMSVFAFFKSIRKQTGLKAQYDDAIFSEQQKLSVKFVEKPVSEVLNSVLSSQGIAWRIQNNIILLKRQSASSPANLHNSATSDTLITSMIGTVTGKVTDASGNPLPGATIMVKGTKHGASSDANGNFSIAEVKQNEVLVITSIGFEAREIQVKGKSVLAQLNVDVNDLDEAVVVAYNTTTQRTNTGAVTVVKGSIIENLPNRSIDRSLQGLVPGLLVTSGSGQPGGGLSNFVLRGIGTGTSAEYGSTVRNPLIVIDGVPVTQDYLERPFSGGSITPVSNPMAQFNPGDVESISILKDAAAIALYGTRAANGVILITTKKGKASKTVFNFRHQTDISGRLKDNVKLLNQEEYLSLLFESYKNLDPSWTDAKIKSDLISKFPTIINSPGDTSFYPATNWLKELTNNRAITISNDLSLSGGNERTNFYLNFSYLNQTGIVKNTGYDRASVRYNIESRPADWITVGLNSSFSYNKEDYSSVSVADAYLLSPLNPARLVDGSYNWVLNYGTYYNSPTANPVAAQEYNINRILAYRQNASGFAEIKILRDLKFRSLVGIDFMLSNAKNKVDPRLPSGEADFPGVGVGSITEYDTKRSNVLITNTLRYDRKFAGNHLFSLLIGQEAQEQVNKIISASSQGLAVPYFEQVSNGTMSRFGSGYQFKESLLSYFSQANYEYKNKYFLSASLRRDGSSKFGLNERYGNYWSMGLGWILTEESFMKSTAKWLSYLKLRGSMGTSGNAAAISSVSRFYQLSLTNYAGNPAARTFPNPGNEDIQWEQTLNTDVGVEARLFKERIGVTADVYKRKTSNLIFPIIPPGVSGYTHTYFENIGDIENKGVEIALFAKIIQHRNFQWNLQVTWSTNKNKLVKAYESFPKYRLGREWSAFYRVRWAGVNAENGKPQWLDSTGKVTDVYNPMDFVKVGKSQPDGFGGITSSFTYKSFEVSAFFYYQYGYEIFDGALSNLVNDGANSPHINQSRQALDRWQKPGDIASNPRRVLGNFDGGNQGSTRYLFNGDYIRLKNVSLSYTVPQNLAKQLRFSSCKLFIQAYNLAVWTKYKGSDPENVGVTGLTSLTYPQSRSFSAGINITF